MRGRENRTEHKGAHGQAQAVSGDWRLWCVPTQVEHHTVAGGHS
jgi:hypothetical protein